MNTELKSWQCPYCHGEAAYGHTYCSESCENHAAQEKLLNNVGHAPPARVEMVPPPFGYAIHESTASRDARMAAGGPGRLQILDHSHTPLPNFVAVAPVQAGKMVFAASDYVLPTDSEERKQIPLFSGCLNYFPLALAAVARVSKRGNDKHNPGQEIHWARGKSTDHADCIARHLLDIETINAQGEYEDAMALAWRALAKLQELEEKRLGKPMSRGSKQT